LSPLTVMCIVGNQYSRSSRPLYYSLYRTGLWHTLYVLRSFPAGLPRSIWLHSRGLGAWFPCLLCGAINLRSVTHPSTSMSLRAESQAAWARASRRFLKRSTFHLFSSAYGTFYLWQVIPSLLLHCARDES